MRSRKKIIARESEANGPENVVKLTRSRPGIALDTPAGGKAGRSQPDSAGPSFYRPACLTQWNSPPVSGPVPRGRSEEVSVRGIASLVTIGLAGTWALCGCADSKAPAPPPARIPGMNERQVPEPWQRPEPLANRYDRDLPPPPFE